MEMQLRERVTALKNPDVDALIAHADMLQGSVNQQHTDLDASQQKLKDSAAAHEAALAAKALDMGQLAEAHQAELDGLRREHHRAVTATVRENMTLKHQLQDLKYQAERAADLAALQAQWAEGK